MFQFHVDVYFTIGDAPDGVGTQDLYPRVRCD